VLVVKGAVCHDRRPADVGGQATGAPCAGLPLPCTRRARARTCLPSNGRRPGTRTPQRRRPGEGPNTSKSGVPKHEAMADASHQRMLREVATSQSVCARDRRREAEAALLRATADAAARVGNLRRPLRAKRSRIRSLRLRLRAERSSLGNERRQRDSLQALLEQASGRAEAATAHAADFAREAEEVAESRDDLRRELGDAQRQAHVTARRASGSSRSSPPHGRRRAYRASSSSSSSSICGTRRALHASGLRSSSLTCMERRSYGQSLTFDAIVW